MNKYCEFAGIGLIPWGPLSAGQLARPLSVESSARADSTQNSAYGRKMHDWEKEIVNRVEKVVRSAAHCWLRRLIQPRSHRSRARGGGRCHRSQSRGSTARSRARSSASARPHAWRKRLFLATRSRRTRSSSSRSRTSRRRSVGTRRCAARRRAKMKTVHWHVIIDCITCACFLLYVDFAVTSADKIHFNWL
jgi:hypothetical protein